MAFKALEIAPDKCLWFAIESTCCSHQQLHNHFLKRKTRAPNQMEKYKMHTLDIF